MISLNRDKPQYPAAQDVLYYEGKTFTVEWYYAVDGRLPGLEYYQSLDKGEQKRLDYMIKYLADNSIGTRLSETMYRVEDRGNKIYAFKPGGQRFFNFMTEGRKIIITNAYQKHSQKMARQDLEKLGIAAKYRADYLKRVGEGVYYEK